LLKKVQSASLEAFREVGKSAPEWEPLQKLDEVERSERTDRLQGGRDSEE
jgi:hypothetical protein